MVCIMIFLTAKWENMKEKLHFVVGIVKDMTKVAKRTFFQDLNLGYKAKSPKINGLSKKMLVTFCPSTKTISLRLSS